MQVKQTPVAQLIPFVNNARIHSEAQIAQIAASIQEFGFTNPILIDGTNGVIAGHGRLLAAQKLKLLEVPCISLEHLSKSQKKAYIIADNKLALNAGWDEELLRLELEDLHGLEFNLDILGFDADELNKLLKFEFAEGTIDDQQRLDEVKPLMVACPDCGTQFDAKNPTVKT